MHFHLQLESPWWQGRVIKVFKYECGVYVPSFAAFNFWRRDEIRGRASEVKRRFSAEPQLAMLITEDWTDTELFTSTSLLSAFATYDSIYLTHSKSLDFPSISGKL
jgi:hypothetical protein